MKDLYIDIHYKKPLLYVIDQIHIFQTDNTEVYFMLTQDHT